MLRIRGMRAITFLCSAALVLGTFSSSATLAQERGLPPGATGQSRIVVSYEISATVISRRLPSEWADAIPEPLLAEMQADEHFASIDLGSTLGNGVLIRFDFDGMESYREWNDRAEVQQMLAEIGQAIGYGYSRTALSMRRVAVDTRATPAAPPRRAPAPKPVQPPKVTTRAAVRSS
jgi:hypothetical protein